MCIPHHLSAFISHRLHELYHPYARICKSNAWQIKHKIINWKWVLENQLSQSVDTCFMIWIGRADRKRDQSRVFCRRGFQLRHDDQREITDPKDREHPYSRSKINDSVNGCRQFLARRVGELLKKPRKSSTLKRHRHYISVFKPSYHRLLYYFLHRYIQNTCL